METGHYMNDFHHPHTLKLENTTSFMDNIKTHGSQFNPYEFNAGTVATVTGEDCIVIASDTRVSRGYSILHRNFSKAHKLAENIYLLTSGMIADTQALRKKLDETVNLYEEKMGRKPNVSSFASLLGKTLYGKRFFPYYTFNLLVGLTPEGKGVAYGYDAIGSYDVLNYGVQGSGQQLMVGVLDNQFQAYHHLKKSIPKDAEEICSILVDTFQSAAERDIYTGDAIEVIILRKNQPEERRRFKIRSD